MTNNSVESATDHQQTSTNGTPSAPESPAQQQSHTAPQGWSGEEKQHFDALPSHVQAVIHRRDLERERGFTEKSTRLAELAKLGESVETALSPHREHLQSSGYDNQRAAQEIMQTAAAQLAANRSGTLQQHTAPDSHAVSDDVDVDGIPTNGELVEIRANMARLERQLATERTRAASSAIQSVEEKQYPLMGDVRQQVQGMVSGHGFSVDDAYHAAVGANPALRGRAVQLLREQIQAEQQEKSKNHAAQAAQAARVNIGGNTPGADMGTRPQRGRSVEDDVLAAFNALQNRQQQ